MESFFNGLSGLSGLSGGGGTNPTFKSCSSNKTTEKYKPLFIMILICILMLCSMSAVLKRHPVLTSPRSLQADKIPYYMMANIIVVTFLVGYLYNFVYCDLYWKLPPKYNKIIIVAVGAACVYLVLQLYFNWYNEEWITFEYMWETYFFHYLKRFWFFLGRFFEQTVTNIPKVGTEIEIKFGNSKEGPFGSSGKYWD